MGDRLPYIVTMLFAAMGWGVTHSVDRLLSSPVVQFETETKTAGNKTSFVVTLRNLSHDRLYKNLRLIFLLPSKDGGEFLTAQTIAKPPAWDGDRPPTVTAKSVQFDLPALHPSSEVALRAEFIGAVVPIVRLERAEPTVRLVAPSFETFLLKHEFKIIVGALLVWAGVLAAMVGMRWGKKSIAEQPPE